MPNVIIRKNDMSQEQYQSCIDSMQHLADASKDINDWEFKVCSPPDWAPKSTDHIFEGRCKKTGITQPWMIDVSQAEITGSFDEVHTFYIEQFTESLIYLAEWQREQRARELQNQIRLALPTMNIALPNAAKDMLWRGDHPNNFV